MITIRVSCSSDDCLTELEMHGHASTAAGRRGANVVCSAVTGLVRSCAEALTGRGMDVTGTAEREGELHLRLRSVRDTEREWLRGVTDVLTGGLRRMASEAPEEVALEVTRSETDGT